jgi:dynein heavy chain 1
LDIIRRDLDDVILICKGEKKQTNYHRQMLSELTKSMIPGDWKMYTIPIGCTVIQWVTDFSDRVKQMQKISSACTSGGASVLKGQRVWLGGLFNPEAYVTATRQFVAQANSWSLEELALEVHIPDSSSNDSGVVKDDCSFGIVGLKLQGARSKGNVLQLDSTIMTELSLTNIRWMRVKSSSEQSTKTKKVTLPVYLNSTRSELLFTVDLDAKEIQSNFFARGVAFIASTALG